MHVNVHAATGEFDSNGSELVLIVPTQPNNRIATCENSLNIRFTNKIVNTWNSLPNSVVTANTANMFKNRLENFWENQDIMCDFDAQLHCGLY